MSKKLVLCLDGTSNRYCRDNTNVVKLAALLDKSATDQLLYYQPGIGTIAPPGVFTKLWKWILTRLDLAFAILLKYHVQDAYRFLMRYYEEGDQIFIFGFSRGAYTARVLAGMLYKVGLLSRGNEELVSFAWDRYANSEEAESDTNERSIKLDETEGFRNAFSREVLVDLVGVWDTVSSVRYAGRDVHFPYTFDNPNVRKVRQAMALDERRAYFRQNLWKEPARPKQDIKQIWFAGVHCDVGGGYLERDSGLSKIALKWMLDEIGGQLAFDPAAVKKMLPENSSDKVAAASPIAKIHESLHGLWLLVELIPKRVNVQRDDGTWTREWIIPHGHRRRLKDNAIIHPTVYERMRRDENYRPPNLPGSGTPSVTDAVPRGT